MRGPAGQRIGTLCVIDQKPRQLTAQEIDWLEMFGGWVEAEIRQLLPTQNIAFKDETLLHNLIDVMPQEIALLDRQANIVAVNESWVTFARENGGGTLLGENYLEASSKDLGSRQLREVLDGERPFMSLEYPCHSPTQQRWFRMQARPVQNHRLVMVIHEDVTAAHERETATLEKERAELIARAARQQDQFKTKVMNTVAHEFNTPLTSMNIDLQLLARSPQPRHIQQLQKGLLRLRTLVDEMVDAIKLKSDQMAHARFHSLAQLAASFETVAKQLNLANPVNVHWHGEGGALIDPYWLQRLAALFLGNAARFSCADQDIDIRLHCDQLVHIEIQDYGAGIEAQVLDMVFDQFGRREVGQAGPGLGMHVCKQIVENAGGSVGAFSKGAGTGTTMWIDLPKAKPEAKQ